MLTVTQSSTTQYCEPFYLHALNNVLVIRPNNPTTRAESNILIKFRQTAHNHNCFAVAIANDKTLSLIKLTSK